MVVTRPSFSIPILCIDDYLSAEEARDVLQECLDLRRIYLPARVYDGVHTTRVDESHRKNESISLDEVFRGAPDRSDILRTMKRRIWSDEVRPLWHQGYTIFDVINYSTNHECAVSRYDTDHFFHKHHDTRRDHITYRLVTLVYYVNKMPASFTGGALVIWDDANSVRIEPKHNRAIVFPSFAMHEVEPTTVVGDAWDDARFSINYWIGFR